jgi:hypothetical protein
MPRDVAFADNSSLARNKTPKPRITPRVRSAIDAIVERGIAYNEAAAEVGLTTRAMRLAFEKPHVLSYLQQQLKVLRGAREPRNFHRLCSIADSDTNLMASVNAIRTLQMLGDEQTNRPSAPSPGVTIRIVNVAQMPPPSDIKAPRIIDADAGD